MKTTILISLILLSGLAAKSQVIPASSNSNTPVTASGSAKTFASPGCVELGGSFSFTSQSITDPNSNSTVPTSSLILFAPYIGFFPVQGFELGLNPFSVSTESGSGYGQTSLLFLFAPSYNFKTHSIAYPFIEGEIGYTSITGYPTLSGGNSTTSGLSYGGRAGVKLEIAPHAIMNIALQYLVQNYSLNGSSEGSENNLVIGIGFTVRL